MIKNDLSGFYSHLDIHNRSKYVFSVEIPLVIFPGDHN